MNLLLFAVILIISLIIVRIGAVAFELTGVRWSIAKFQSLSCFTKTGFTTKEAELITTNPQRRRIASILMILGHAGFVTLVATFANSLRSNTLIPQFKIPFVEILLPKGLVPWLNLVFLAFIIYFIFHLFTSTRFAKRITHIVRKRMIKNEIIKPVTFEELIVSTGGYSVSQIEVCKGSSIIDKKLKETDLRKHDINILVIERQGEAIPNPPANSKILFGDKLICFGKLENIRKILCTMPL
ncbi:cation:proton antiporter regulatory subunit [bacterium]